MPLRKCIGCNEVKDTSQLIKILKEHNSREIFINPNFSHFGRSSYVCYNIKCVQSAIKKRRLQKTLKAEIPEQITEQLKSMAKN